jgi:CRP-like cAMP-binding protein
MEKTEILKEIVLFKDLTTFEIIKVNKVTKTRNFKSDEIIFKEGAIGDSLYIVKSGSVRVTKLDDGGEEKVLAILNPGDHFGEIALVDNHPRSATVIANEDTELIQIQADDFNKLLESDKEIALKFYKSFVKVLCTRLRDTNESLTFSRSLLESMDKER